MMREEEWIEAARQGDQDAFAELVRLYEKRHGQWALIDDVQAGSVGCEYGEYGPPSGAPQAEQPQTAGARRE